MLYMMWNNFAWNALFGPGMIAASFYMAWIVLIIPDSYPTYDNFVSKDGEVDDTTGMWYTYVGYLAYQSLPNMFFTTQIFTFGASNISDLSLFYMTPGEAWLYFTINAFLIAGHWPLAVTVFSVFWWIYAIQFIVWCVDQIIGSDDDMKSEGKGASTKGGKGMKDGGKGP